MKKNAVNKLLLNNEYPSRRKMEGIIGKGALQELNITFGTITSSFTMKLHYE